MKNELFDELLASVQEMDKIVQGKKEAARVTDYPEPEVKVMGEDRSVSGALRLDDRCEQAHAGKLGAGPPSPHRTR